MSPTEELSELVRHPRAIRGERNQAKVSAHPVNKTAKDRTTVPQSNLN